MPDPLEFSGFGETGGAETEQTPPTPPEPQPQQTSDFYDTYLKNIPAQDRAIVSRYVKDWDAGVTKRFQELQGKLKPWEELKLPLDQVQQALRFSTGFQQDPERSFRLMWNALQEHYGEEFSNELLRILELQEGEMSEFDNGQQPVGGEPDPDEVWRGNVQSELEELRQWRQEQINAAQEAEETKQLDGVLSAMHTKFGDFDDQWILGRLAEHGDVNKAIQEWNAMLQKFSQGNNREPQRRAPVIPGGQGGVPKETIDPKTLRGQDRKAAVAAMLAGLGE